MAAAGTCALNQQLHVLVAWRQCSRLQNKTNFLLAQLSQLLCCTSASRTGNRHAARYQAPVHKQHRW